MDASKFNDKKQLHGTGSLPYYAIVESQYHFESTTPEHADLVKRKHERSAPLLYCIV